MRYVVLRGDRGYADGICAPSVLQRQAFEPEVHRRRIFTEIQAQYVDRGRTVVEVEEHLIAGLIVDIRSTCLTVGHIVEAVVVRHLKRIPFVVVVGTRGQHQRERWQQQKFFHNFNYCFGNL